MDGLRGARAEASIRLTRDHHVSGEVAVSTEVTVRVPAAWPLGHHLLLSETAAPYREALACLLGGDPGEAGGQGRDGTPEVTVVKGGTEVRSPLFARLATRTGDDETMVGPWSVRQRDGRWHVRLQPAKALERVVWTRITVDPGWPGAVRASPPPDTGTAGKALVWRSEDGGAKDDGAGAAPRPEVTIPFPGDEVDGDMTDLAVRCAVDRLRGARAEASIRLLHDGRVHTKITSELTVRVPAVWPLAPDLLLSRDSEAYRRAMGCLLRGDTPGDLWGDGRFREWRTSEPEVTPVRDGFRVRSATYSWIDTQDGDDDLLLGPWRVRTGVRHWRVRFQPSEALLPAGWSRISVDPGSPGADEASPAPAERADGTALVWKPAGAGQPAGSPPDISVGLTPDWQRSWAARSSQPPFSVLSGAGELLSYLVVSGLLIHAAGAASRRRTGSAGPGPGGGPTGSGDAAGDGGGGSPPGTRTAAPAARGRPLRRRLRRALAPPPPGPPGAPRGRERADAEAFRSLRRWGWAVLPVALVVEGDDLLFNQVGWSYPDALVWGTAPGLVLLLFARPPRPVVAAGAVLLAVPLLGAWVMEQRADELAAGAAWLSPGAQLAGVLAVQGCGLALCLLGFTAAGWRLARDGGLHRGRLLLRWAVPAVLGVLVFAAVGWALASERNFRRYTWLRPHEELAFGEGHTTFLTEDAAWFASVGQDWLFAYLWVLTGVAILGALKASVEPVRVSPLERRPERLLVLVFFPVVVGIDLGWYAGNGALCWVWVFLHMAALRLMAAAGARRAVLGLRLEGSEERLETTVTGERRALLMGRARRYREIHATLRRLDQGQADDTAVERRALERELSELHDWTDSAGTACRLPGRISVVDAALALGPENTWWANGRRGALLAAFFGLPASALTTWASAVRGDAWTNALHYGFGLPDTVLTFLYWQLGWVGAGFVLGALWRVLPGRRGAVKALPVAAAFGLPLALDAVVARVMNESQSSHPLYAAAMLLVLTLTGIAVDLETFRGERRYWQSRLGLLLSVYQMRYLSLQFAYVLVQIAGVITVWDFFTDTGGPPPAVPGSGEKGADG
ncbi:DUF6185 family protein [Streptomyces zingiberis]|uniref:Uncharacterized protein n=1 Tax=Streptomyces zingiberis TaxID=2053010 RepID=A0ABX1BQX5_9ACTN|nr:hypothetical protein [Streptomyces zingiberis]